MNYSAALVTGGARRLGRAMVLGLAARGIDVVIHCFSGLQQANDTAAQARALGVKAVTLRADLLSDADVEDLIPQACEAIGKPLDVLINNASVFEYDTLRSATADSWDRHLRSNLRAPFFLTQAFAAQAPDVTVEPGGEPLASACVINMLDQRMRKLTPEFASYTIAKMGLWAFTRTAAQELAPQIRVNAIGPGPTLQGARQTKTHFEAQRNATLLQRGSNPQDIVAAMNFILDAPGLTGQLMCIDGGQHLAWQTPDILGPDILETE
jgi:NAD(P)-dependent dehydrogenase (short-subunit alcohol dehydrogenase family)